MIEKKRRHLFIFAENLCRDFCNNKINASGLKHGLNELLQDYEYLGDLRFQAVSKALGKAIEKYCKQRETEIWRLATELEPRLRK